MSWLTEIVLDKSHCLISCEQLQCDFFFFTFPRTKLILSEFMYGTLLKKKKKKKLQRK